MQRPTSVTVFGILNVLFACIGVIGILASITMVYTSGDSNNPVVKIMHESRPYELFMKISIPLGVLTSIILLVAGIGLLSLKGWGRTLSIAYGIYSIVFGIISMAISWIFLLRPLLAQASQHQGPEAAGAIGGAVGGAFGGCFGMIYPILLLIFMFRPNVVAAFPPTPTLNAGP